MTAPKSVILAPDAAVGRTWAAPLLAAGCTARVIERLGDYDGTADLLVAHGAAPMELGQALSKLLGTSACVAVVPEPGIAGMLAALRAPCARGVVVSSYLDARLLTYLSAKVLRGDIFGVSKLLPWGTRVHSEMVNDQEQRAAAIATVGELARELGLRGKYREGIELVLDELLMNALYAAPVAEDGSPLYGDVAPADRGNLRLERPVIVQVATDGAYLAVSVRDSFGSLKRETVLGHLQRCAAAGSDQIERKTSGAGLGLWLVANNVTEFVMNVLPGTATEIVAVFDLKAPRQQLQHLGIYEEPMEQPGEAEPAKRIAVPGQAARPTRLISLTLATAIAMIVVALALLVLPLIIHPGKGTLEVTADPSGAVIYVDGARRGEASPRLRIPELDAATRHTVAARLPGHKEAQQLVDIGAGRIQRVKLTLGKGRGRVKLSSTPPRARIILEGRPTGLETPAELDDLEVGRPHAVKLERAGCKSTATTLVASTEEVRKVHVDLPVASDHTRLSFQTTPPGAKLFINEVDTGQVTPISRYTVRAGQRYRLKLAVPGRVPWEQEYSAKGGAHFERKVELFEGGLLTLNTNVKARLFVGDGFSIALPAQRRPVPSGSHRARVRGDAPYVDATFNLEITAGELTTKRLDFGFVATKQYAIKVERRTVSKIALMPGKHTVVLVDRSGRTRSEPVEIIGGRTINLD
jgi:anti-sigma regulatory factor (Ser/Thr protein kinase)